MSEVKCKISLKNPPFIISIMVKIIKILASYSANFSNSLIIHKFKTKNHNREGGLDTLSQLISIDFDNFISPFSHYFGFD